MKPAANPYPRPKPKMKTETFWSSTLSVKMSSHIPKSTWPIKKSHSPNIPSSNPNPNTIPPIHITKPANPPVSSIWSSNPVKAPKISRELVKNSPINLSSLLNEKITSVLLNKPLKKLSTFTGKIKKPNTTNSSSSPYKTFSKIRYKSVPTPKVFSKTRKLTIPSCRESSSTLRKSLFLSDRPEWIGWETKHPTAESTKPLESNQSLASKWIQTRLTHESSHSQIIANFTSTTNPFQTAGHNLSSENAKNQAFSRHSFLSVSQTTKKTTLSLEWAIAQALLKVLIP